MKKIIFCFYFFIVFSFCEIQYISTTTNGTNIFRGMLTNSYDYFPYEYLVYSLQGSVVAASNQVKIHVPFDCTFGPNAYAALFDAPIGTNMLIDVRLNGTSILTASNLSIENGAFKGTNTIATSTANFLDQLAIDVLRVGTTTNGSFLTVVIPVRRR